MSNPLGQLFNTTQKWFDNEFYSPSKLRITHTELAIKLQQVVS